VQVEGEERSDRGRNQRKQHKPFHGANQSPVTHHQAKAPPQLEPWPAVQP
jgi:hypothetical protein